MKLQALIKKINQKGTLYVPVQLDCDTYLVKANKKDTIRALTISADEDGETYMEIVSYDNKHLTLQGDYDAKADRQPS